MSQVISAFGLVAFVALAYWLSSKRQAVEPRLVLSALALQLALAFLVLGIPAWGISGPVYFLFSFANDAVLALLGFTLEGSRFLFGPLVDSEGVGYIFAFQVLPTIIFFASLMTVLYHLGLMQRLVQVIAWIMQKTLGTSGAESLSVAANIFVGQTEAPLMVKPYVSKMTSSELFAVMVGGMATVAGGVLAAYVGLLKDRIPDIAGHLLTASVMSAPAALAIAKIMIPETAIPETKGHVPKELLDHKETSNVIDAAASGAAEGLRLALNVAAMLLAFIALLAMLDGILGLFGQLIGFQAWGQSLVPASMTVDGPVELSFSLLLGWIFAPMAWIMGVPWSEAMLAGTLLGEKIMLNEFVAYLHLSEVMHQLSDRTVIILSYALCGFANFSSIAIQIGGIGGIAPERKKDLAQLGVRAVIGGSLAAFLTATIAGILS